MGAPAILSTPRGAEATCRPLATAKFHTISQLCGNSNVTNYYDSNHHRSTPSGDPAVFGLPCRFPAALLIRPGSCIQGLDQKRLFGVARAPGKIFSLSFPERQGSGAKVPSAARRGEGNNKLADGESDCERSNSPKCYGEFERSQSDSPSASLLL